MTESREFRLGLLAAGFSSHTINALIRHSRVGSLEQLKNAPWGDRRVPGTLAWQLATTPNLGRKGIAEVEAFRAGLDPGTARAPGLTYTSVPLSPVELNALDAFLAKQPKKVSRPEAIRAFVATGLPGPPIQQNEYASLVVFGQKLTPRADGSMKVEPVDGDRVVELAADGSVNVDLKKIHRVEVENVLDLESYNTSTVGGRRMHIIEFIGGGRCELTYRLNGALEVFEAERLSVSFNSDGSVILRRHQIIVSG